MKTYSDNQSVDQQWANVGLIVLTGLLIAGSILIIA